MTDVALPAIGACVYAPTWDDEAGNLSNWEHPEKITVTESTVSGIRLSSSLGGSSWYTPAEYITALETGYFREAPLTKEPPQAQQEVKRANQWGSGDLGSVIYKPVTSGKKKVATLEFFRQHGYI